MLKWYHDSDPNCSETHLNHDPKPLVLHLTHLRASPRIPSSRYEFSIVAKLQLYYVVLINFLELYFVFFFARDMKKDKKIGMPRNYKDIKTEWKLV